MKHRGITRRDVLSIGAAALLGLLSGCGTAPASSADASSLLPTITVGCDIYPPYTYTSTDGILTGIDIELAREAFHRMGYAPDFLTIPWEEKKELVESGAIDCIWSSFSIDGREDEYTWAGPYMSSRQVVAVRTDSSLYSLADLAGCTVAVQSTTKPESLFLAQDGTLPPLKNLICLQDRELIYTFLGKGYVDAAAAHETAIQQYMADYGLHFRILDEPLQIVGLGVAFAKDDTRGIAEALDRTLTEMQADGTTAEILSRFLAEPDRYLEVDP